MPKIPSITPDEIEKLKKQINPETGRKYTQADIARMYGITRSAVSWIKRHGLRGGPQTFSKTVREEVMEHYPWTPGKEFHDAQINKRMRDHAEFVATGGDGMSEYKLRRLYKFYKLLEEEDLVVEFDPNIPPYPGCSTGGFAYRKRNDSDGDLIVRVNEYTTLTEKGAILWRKPPRKPLVD